MKFDRYLILDAEHDHEVGKLMPKLKVISGFAKENIENVFGINNKWIPKNNEKLFFVYGFKKSKKANISSKEELALKELADVLLNLTGQQLNKLLEDRKLFLVEA